MKDYNYRLRDIQRVITNIDNYISKISLNRVQANKEWIRQFYDGYISGLKRAKYFLMVLRNQQGSSRYKIKNTYKVELPKEIIEMIQHKQRLTQEQLEIVHGAVKYAVNFGLYAED